MLRSLIVLFGLLAFSLVAIAAPPLPDPTRRVSDAAAMLSAAYRARLESELANYEHETGHQFGFASIESLEGGSIEEYCLKAAEALRLGDEKRDDGVLLCVARKERKTRIEVGYGLEGAIPDALAAKIVRYEIRPAFQAGDFESGVEKAFTTLKKAASGEAVGVGPSEKGGDGVPGWIRLMGILVMVFLVIATRGGILPWLFLAGGGGGGSRRSGGYGGFSGGGGGFGGGGASGDW